MRNSYDVVIIGSGPAGILAAFELSQKTGYKILLMDKGNNIESRSCPAREQGGACLSCKLCNAVSGFGGAGAYSDGKLTLSSQIGGNLTDYIGNEKTDELILQVDELFAQFGGASQIYGSGAEVEQLVNKACLAELRLMPVAVRHMGTDRCYLLVKTIHDYLVPKVDIVVGQEATKLLVKDNIVTGVETSDGNKIEANYVVLAPGREGADWLAHEAGRLGLTLFNNPVDVGVRVELPKVVLEELTTALYESKLEFCSDTFGDRIRTFCMCPGGEVTMEYAGGNDPVLTVNGHSYAERHTNNTNFALLVSTTFSEPFREPIAYAKYLARLANLLSGGVMVQRFGDLMLGRRSTPERIKRGLVEPTLKSAIPGDLSFVLPYRHLKGIIEMLYAMDKLAPGVASRHTLLYGVEVKYYSCRLSLTENLESEITNLFAIGDGAGVSRGLVQSAASGIVVAQELSKRLANSQPSQRKSRRRS